MDLGSLLIIGASLQARKLMQQLSVSYTREDYLACWGNNCSPAGFPCYYGVESAGPELWE
jgi:hypothetical protein